MPRNGEECKELWGIPANQVLYHEDGTWYHVLEHFPAALCDAHGYVLFKTEQAYKDCPQLRISEEKKYTSVPGGIANIPGYVLKQSPLLVPPEFAEAFEATFGLERDLQHALRENIDQLEPGLTIVDGGAERIVPAGRIDILARDKQSVLVVIELKAVEADKNAVGQVLAYMGDLQREEKGKSVRGIVVAPSFKHNAIAAALMAPNVELREYKFRFLFEAANDPLSRSAST